MAALPPTIIVHDHRDPTYDGTPQVPEPPTSEQVNAQWKPKLHKLLRSFVPSWLSLLQLLHKWRQR